jgi:cytochrome c oxidase subunit 1
VWAHHMFTVGLGPVANTAFAVSTILISVPTGIMIFNWLATTWRGEIRLQTPMLFALGFIAMFTLGGLSGATHTIVPHNYQQSDTYYVVAHFHYVLFGGSVMGLFAGVYYWFPKVTGRLLDERLGKLHFWLMFAGFNLTFGPMHILGLQGQPRRTYTYDEGMGWDLWNAVATAGALTIAASILVFIGNVRRTLRSPVRAPEDPWDARTLEWATSSPPPEYNFARIPVCRSVDSFWHDKYAEDDDGWLVRVPAGGAGDEPGGHGDGHGGHGIHMPSASYMPALAALGLPIVGFAAIYGWEWGVLGAVICGFGVCGWASEPLSE